MNKEALNKAIKAIVNIVSAFLLLTIIMVVGINGNPVELSILALIIIASLSVAIYRSNLPTVKKKKGAKRGKKKTKN